MNFIDTLRKIDTIGKNGIFGFLREVCAFYVIPHHLRGILLTRHKKMSK